MLLDKERSIRGNIMADKENKDAMDFKKIGLIGAGAVVALVLVGYAIAFVINENRYISYYDKFYKISIKYPKGWNAIPDHGGSIVAFISNRDNELDSFAENFNISVTDLPQHVTTLAQFSKIATGQMEAVFERNAEVLQSEEIVFAGMPAFSYVIRTTQEPVLNLRFVWFFRDNKAIVLTYVIQELAYEKYIKIFNHMLRSFSIGA